MTRKVKCKDCGCSDFLVEVKLTIKGSGTIEKGKRVFHSQAVYDGEAIVAECAKCNNTTIFSKVFDVWDKPSDKEVS